MTRKFRTGSKVDRKYKHRSNNDPATPSKASNKRIWMNSNFMITSACSAIRRQPVALATATSDTAPPIVNTLVMATTIVYWTRVGRCDSCVYDGVKTKYRIHNMIMRHVVRVSVWGFRIIPCFESCHMATWVHIYIQHNIDGVTVYPCACKIF